MAIYLKVEGLNGEVSAAGHEKWIECNSLQWGVGRAITTRVGGGADREASQPSISEVTVSKLMDKATPNLFYEACIGKGKKVEIHLCKTEDQLANYMTYELTNAMISGYSMSSGGDRPSESLSFNFTKIVMKYTPYDSKGTAGSPLPAGYDLSIGKKV